VKILSATVSVIGSMCSACAAPGYEPPALAGEVMDNTTKAPIPDAQITVESYWHPDETLHATSDSSGKFSIPKASWEHIMHWDISYGWTDARVTASAAKYKAGVAEVLDLSGSDARGVNIYLTPQ
jgi:hypothetical protein